jgi:hypothetical protein
MRRGQNCHRLILRSVHEAIVVCRHQRLPKGILHPQGMDPRELSSEHAQADEEWLAEKTVFRVLRGLKEDLATMFRLETKAL